MLRVGANVLGWLRRVGTLLARDRLRLRGGVEALALAVTVRHRSVLLGGVVGLLGGVQQAGLDRRLGADVAALAHAGRLADAVAQVVQLGAAHVAAGGDLDPLDLRRVQRERALDADAEGLLADGEGLARALSLALDRNAFEDLRAPPGALDHDEVNAQTIAGAEIRNAAQLGALDVVDDGAHGKKKARTTTRRRAQES